MKSSIFLWNIVCFLTRSIVLMSFFWELLNCVTLFLVKSCINLVEKKVAYSQYKFDRTQKSACWLRLLVFQRHKSSFCFDIRGPRFFLRVAVPIISKRFVKLCTIEYSKKYEVIRWLVSNLRLMFAHLLKRAWKNERGKWKIFENLLWNSLSSKTTVVNETLLGKTQSRIARISLAWT